MLGSLVRQDLEERRASQGLLERGVWQALQGEKVPQVPWDHLDHQGQREHLAPLDSKETRETREQDCRGPEVSVVSQVSGVKMATLARKDLVDLWYVLSRRAQWNDSSLPDCRLSWPSGSPRWLWGPLAAGESKERRALLALQGSRVTRVTQL